jgi:hypothetical protein
VHNSPPGTPEAKTPSAHSEETEEKVEEPVLQTPKPSGLMALLRSSQKKPPQATKFLSKANINDLKIIAERLDVPHWKTLNKYQLKATLQKNYFTELQALLEEDANQTRGPQPVPAPLVLG